MRRGRACITWRMIAMGFPWQRGWQGFGREMVQSGLWRGGGEFMFFENKVTLYLLHYSFSCGFFFLFFLLGASKCWEQWKWFFICVFLCFFFFGLFVFLVAPSLRSWQDAPGTWIETVRFEEGWDLPEPEKCRVWRKGMGRIRKREGGRPRERLI